MRRFARNENVLFVLLFLAVVLGPLFLFEAHAYHISRRTEFKSQIDTATSAAVGTSVARVNASWESRLEIIDSYLAGLANVSSQSQSNDKDYLYPTVILQVPIYLFAVWTAFSYQRQRNMQRQHEARIAILSQLEETALEWECINSFPGSQMYERSQSRRALVDNFMSAMASQDAPEDRFRATYEKTLNAFPLEDFQISKMQNT